MYTKKDLSCPKMNNHIRGFDTRNKTRLTNSFIDYVYQDQGHPIKLLEEN